MNILCVHNHYQNPGGEDHVFAAESSLLEQHGHTVHRLAVRNDAIKSMGLFTVATSMIWNRTTQDEIRRIVRTNRIEVVHFHNTFPLISPAAYYAAKSEGARVVQTLHNFRLVCPGSLLMREGTVCEDCLGRAVPWRGIQHACYRNNRLESAGVSSMLVAHRAIGTWQRQVDAYVALSEFSRRKFVQGGLPANSVAVKPNFVDPDPGMGSGQGGYALFVGRLAPEKGLDVLLRAWETRDKVVPLKIVGDGPMKDAVQRASAANPLVEYVGRKDKAEIFGLMQDAACLIAPSLWYEGGTPMTIIEAYATGLPVIASNIGSMAAVSNTGTGLIFTPGSAEDLIDKVQWLIAHPAEAAEFRANARLEFNRHHSAAANYPQLMRIYEQALGR